MGSQICSASSVSRPSTTPAVQEGGWVLLAARRGPLDPATLGAATSSAPDLVLPFLRPGGRKLFHDRLGWHRSGRFPVHLQLLLAGAILGALVAPRSRAVKTKNSAKTPWKNGPQASLASRYISVAGSRANPVRLLPPDGRSLAVRVCIPSHTTPGSLQGSKFLAYWLRGQPRGVLAGVSRGAPRETTCADLTHESG